MLRKFIVNLWIDGQIVTQYDKEALQRETRIDKGVLTLFGRVERA